MGVVALLGLALAGASEGEAPSTGREPIGPIPVPTTNEDLLLIDKTLCDCWLSLGKPNDPALLRACLAETLHSDVPFPPIVGDHESVTAVWALFGQRVAVFMAADNKDAWCNPTVLIPQEPTGLDLLTDMLVSSPQPGYMYQIVQGDTLSNIVRDALNAVIGGAGDSSSNRMQYIKCITSGPNWNWPLYASSSSSPQFPDYYFVNGQGLRRAFYPWHENTKVAVSQGRMPKRGATTATSKPSQR